MVNHGGCLQCLQFVAYCTKLLKFEWRTLFHLGAFAMGMLLCQPRSLRAKNLQPRFPPTDVGNKLLKIFPQNTTRKSFCSYPSYISWTHTDMHTTMYKGAHRNHDGLMGVILTYQQLNLVLLGFEDIAHLRFVTCFNIISLINSCLSQMFDLVFWQPRYACTAPHQ